jgi:hypothetical protein
LFFGQELLANLFELGLPALGGERVGIDAAQLFELFLGLWG